MLSLEEINTINQTLLFELPPVKTDIALVFGQGVYSALLVPHVAKGLAEGRYARIIIAGGAEVLNTHDAALLVPFMKKNGLPEDKLPHIGEKEADYIFRLLPEFAQRVSGTKVGGLNTGENVAYSRPLGLDTAGSITVVCAASMSARAIGTLRKHYPDPYAKPISSLPVYPPGINAQNWTQHPFAASSMTSEFRKLREYLDLGFIVPVSLFSERQALQVVQSNKPNPTP